MTCCIITGLFISLKNHCENVSEKEPIFADEGATRIKMRKIGLDHISRDNDISNTPIWSIPNFTAWTVRGQSKGDRHIDVCISCILRIIWFKYASATLRCQNSHNQIIVQSIET
jgi:hypothetical protein